MGKEILLMVEIHPDIAVLPVKCGEKPLKGIAGRIDWICGGVLSRFIFSGKVKEESGEKFLYYNPEKFDFPLIFLFYSDEDSLKVEAEKVITDISPRRVFIDLSIVRSSIELNVDGIEVFMYSTHL